MGYYLLTFLYLIIIIFAEVLVQIRYKKYSKILNSKKISGFEVAKKILEENGLEDIYIVETQGFLSDHYDPTNKVIRLSHEIFHGENISALAVAAHECGHAIQYKEGNIFIKIMILIFPIVNLCSKLSYAVILISLFTGFMKLFYLGIAMLLIILFFQLVTLPVEFDASNKALNEMKRLDICENTENDSCKKVLFAAALTYVASLANFDC